ncbi:MAG: DUF4743 domain-containing protein [Pseudomonadota bacterium]|nr:DUF4743 domain-containing protein [Pseudomonadota bacterium]
MTIGPIVQADALLASLAAELAAPRGPYLPLSIGDVVVGWLDPERAESVARFAEVFHRDGSGLRLNARLETTATRTAAVGRVVEVLAAEGCLTAWRDERYALAGHWGAEPLCLIERAAARFFGIRTYAAHINGLVRSASTAMWLARRSPNKAIDPGLLDNLVGGGIAAGDTVNATMVREAREEAGIPTAVAATATLAGEVRICRSGPDGLQRETVFVHDLWLEPGFAPSNQDGETVEHRLVSLDQAAAIIADRREPDVLTADASLVIVDFLLRNGNIDRNSSSYHGLDALRYLSLDF